MQQRERNKEREEKRQKVFRDISRDETWEVRKQRHKEGEKTQTHESGKNFEKKIERKAGKSK
jgi:hypothetical protein